MVRDTEYIGIRRFRRTAFAIALIYRCRVGNGAKSAANSLWLNLGADLGLLSGARPPLAPLLQDDLDGIQGRFAAVS